MSEKKYGVWHHGPNRDDSIGADYPTFRCRRCKQTHGILGSKQLGHWKTKNLRRYCKECYEAITKEKQPGTNQVAKLCGCHHYTAMRYLSALHEICVVRICGWHRCFSGPIAKYQLHTGKPDAPMIDKLTPVQRQRKHREKEWVKEREREYAKAVTRQKRVLQGRVRLGVWGL